MRPNWGVPLCWASKKYDTNHILERFLLHLVFGRFDSMAHPSLSKRRFQWSAVAAALCGAIFFGGLLTPEAHTQAPGTTTSNAAINALVARLKTQQDQMAANQTKIEAQTTQLQETLRQARLYSARAGSGHR